MQEASPHVSLEDIISCAKFVTENSTLDEIVNVAKKAEMLTKLGRRGPLSADAAGATGFTQDDDPQMVAMVDEFQSKMRSMGYNPNVSFNRGGGRGGGARGGAAPFPGVQNQPKQICGRCGQYVKHRTDQCIVDLENLKLKGRGIFRGRGGRGGGRGGRGGRGGASQGSVHEADADSSGKAGVFAKDDFYSGKE